MDESCAAIALATEIVYLPFGPVSSVLREGVEPGPPAAVLRQMEYDLQYRTTSQLGAVGSTEVVDRTYVYDRSGNPTHVADSSSGVSRDYGYDDLQRLISSAGDESLSWNYDSVGNRVTQQLEDMGLTTTEYLYVTGTSRLDPVTITEEGMPPVVHDVTLDSAGNVTSDDVSTFLYGPRGTLLRQPSAGTGFAYLYDADGRRVRTSREVKPATTVRHFLLPDGTPYLEDVPGGTQGDRLFVFLGGSLLAILDDSGVARHVFSDHFGFPVAVADDEERVNWQAVSGPFGEIEDVIAGDAANDPFLRYPGQWEVPGLADSGDTRLFYNTHRWYNPAWGRYTQADPLEQILLQGAGSRALARRG